MVRGISSRLAGEEREIAVPGFWERLPGLGNVHEATYRREFDVPESFAGRRVVLRFDAVGDAAEVSVNGQHAGGHVGACLPFEVDITGLVAVPSTAQPARRFCAGRYSLQRAPRRASDRRNRKSWIPRGMGANNRKGLYQAVTLLARPGGECRRRPHSHLGAAAGIERHLRAVQWPQGDRPRPAFRPGHRPGWRSRLHPAGDKSRSPGFCHHHRHAHGPFQRSRALAAGPSDALHPPDHAGGWLAAARALHRKSTRFGFRETWFAGIHFYLNGIRCNLRGESPAYCRKDRPVRHARNGHGDDPPLPGGQLQRPAVPLDARPAARAGCVRRAGHAGH